MVRLDLVKQRQIVKREQGIVHKFYFAAWSRQFKGDRRRAAPGRSAAPSGGSAVRAATSVGATSSGAFGCFKGVDQQHRNGHGADPTRHRGNEAGNFLHAGKV